LAAVAVTIATDRNKLADVRSYLEKEGISTDLIDDLEALAAKLVSLAEFARVAGSRCKIALGRPPRCVANHPDTEPL
jgi:hypothetical protein